MNEHPDDAGESEIQACHLKIHVDGKREHVNIMTLLELHDADSEPEIVEGAHRASIVWPLESNSRKFMGRPKSDHSIVSGRKDTDENFPLDYSLTWDSCIDRRTYGYLQENGCYKKHKTLVRQQIHRKTGRRNDHKELIDEPDPVLLDFQNYLNRLIQPERKHILEADLRDRDTNVNQQDGDRVKKRLSLIKSSSANSSSGANKRLKFGFSGVKTPERPSSLQEVRHSCSDVSSQNQVQSTVTCARTKSNGDSWVSGQKKNSLGRNLVDTQAKQRKEGAGNVKDMDTSLSYVDEAKTKIERPYKAHQLMVEGSNTGQPKAAGRGCRSWVNLPPLDCRDRNMTASSNHQEILLSYESVPIPRNPYLMGPKAGHLASLTIAMNTSQPLWPPTSP